MKRYMQLTINQRINVKSWYKAIMSASAYLLISNGTWDKSLEEHPFI